MPNPGKYSDIGNEAKKLIEDDFFKDLKSKVVYKHPSGITFETECASNGQVDKTLAKGTLKYNIPQMGVDIKKFTYDTKHNTQCEVDLKGLVKGTTFTLRSKCLLPGDFQKADVKVGAIYKDRAAEVEADYNIISNVFSANGFYKYQNLALGCSAELLLSHDTPLNPRKVVFGLSYIEPAYELSTKFEADKKILYLLGFYQVDRLTSVGVRLAKGLESSSSDIPVDIAVKHAVGKGFIKAKADSRMHLGLYTEQAVSQWMKVKVSGDVDMKNVSDGSAYKFGLGAEATF